MAMPKSVVKINKDGVHYTSNVDQAQYTIQELSRSAMRDVAKFVKKKMREAMPVHTGALKSNIGSWVRKDRDGTVWLQVGIYNRATSVKKNKTPVFHSHFLEFGTRKMRAQPFLKPSVFDNLTIIKEIESKYLSALNDEDSKIRSLIDEKEEVAD